MPVNYLGTVILFNVTKTVSKSLIRFRISDHLFQNLTVLSLPKNNFRL